ncbi:DUF4148 domain-containing protein [Caballeronia sp. LZ034LL]|uniref:DUF4148 domain-containing protein n=1 Tax=Caballeronia sp. LZ034LL TaxID=3038567 RepID=UPI00286734B5|nr:DUF4148 domain-containing protein [Caballeronia sp. LZ034LL]MDR5835124.1 DUF4148 domain-containing protein [Caballeronia sp. LZ034LL]
MKKLVQVIAATAMASAVIPAFAQTATPQAQDTMVAATQPAGSAPDGGQADVSPDITRAQVYQDLIQAQQDGQLDHLNRTVYAHH